MTNLNPMPEHEDLKEEFQTMKKAIRKAVCGALVIGFAGFSATEAYAATEHFSDATIGDNWSDFATQWETSVSRNYEQVSLTPGSTQSELNFAWYSKTDAAATPIVKLATKADMSDAKSFQGKASPAIDGYNTNKVTVTGLKENTTYYYTYVNNGQESEPTKYSTKSFSDYKILFVGDPQIGASKGQTVSTGDKLENTSDLNTAARNDAYNWNYALDVATKANPDIGFVISAGDQINKNVTGIDPGNEIEYAGFLYSPILKSLPIATTIGNHDATNKSYSFHFNNPNPFTAEKSPSVAGNGYYYTYGNALFIVLNTNNYNAADHEALIKKAVKEHPDTRWRIVTFHQDIYGSGLDHSESDGMVLRTQLTPIMDKYDVDVVLQGHDHSYSRSYLLESDGKAHAAFDAHKDAEGKFDWDNVVDKATGAVYPFYPKEGDAAAQAANAVFVSENNAYTLTNTKDTQVTNPQGTLYMTANSSTGSKFYELLPQQQSFVAYRNQNWKPSYSVISLNDNSFAIKTYSIVDGKPSQIDSTFTINKTVDRTPVKTAAAPAAGNKAEQPTPAASAAPAAAANAPAAAESQASKTTAPKTGDAADLKGTIAISVLALLGLGAIGFSSLRSKKTKVAK